MAGQTVMQQRLDPLTGTSEWVVLREDASGDEEEDEEGTGARATESSLAHTQYLDMLNDGPRNRAYDAAIRKVVKPGDHVLDIGTGTGLLAMMAWRAMDAAAAAASPEEQRGTLTGSSSDDGQSEAGGTPAAVGVVTACESYLPMIRLARRVLRANGMGRHVRLIHKRSDELRVGTDLTAAADVLVSEILDSELLGEGLIPTLRHAHAHLLKPHARSVPHRATVYGQLVECNYLGLGGKRHDSDEVDADAKAYSFLETKQAEQEMQGFSSANHVDGLADELNLMSHPFEVFKFEFSKMPADCGVCELDISAAKDGRVHALVSWWVLDLEEEGLITYSTAPNWIKTPAETLTWRDHWKQCLWYFPGAGATVCRGEKLQIKAVHDEICIRYSLKLPSAREGPPIGPGVGKPIVGQENDGHPSNLWTISQRATFPGDRNSREAISKAVMKVFQGTLSSPLCLVVDDSLLCSLTAAMIQPNAYIVAMLPGFKRDGSIFLENIAKANAVDFARIRVLKKSAAHLSAEDFEGRKVEVLMAEPYYKAYADLPPWRQLRFWHEKSSLASLLVDHPAVIPCRGILRGVAVSVPDLWNSRRCVTSVAGFEHSQVNRVMGACGDLPYPLEGPLLAYSLWQCGQYKELTGKFSIMNFDLSSHLQAVKDSVKVPVAISGLCHGIALWMDWDMHPEGNLIVSTGPSEHGPTSWKQGVKLLSSPMWLSNKEGKESEPDSHSHVCELVILAAFSPSTGDIDVHVSPA